MTPAAPERAEPDPLRLPGLAGARVVVTGGSRGIGRAVLRLLARAGARVGIGYHRAHDAAAEALAEARTLAPAPAPPERAFWSEAGDLSREADVERLFARCDEEFGGLDGFVGNAGIWNADAAPLERLEPEEWRRMMEVNLDSIYLTSRAAARRLGPGGRMVLLSSTAGQRGEPEHSHYAATKGAIISFAKSLAGELGPRGITVNAVAPGWVDTDMSAPALRGGNGTVPASIREEIPLGRVAAAEDVAGPVVFLLSELGRHVTGEVLNVNGGSVLCG